MRKKREKAKGKITNIESMSGTARALDVLFMISSNVAITAL